MPKWWFVLGLIIAIYCGINLAMPPLPISGTIKTYVFQPILWGFLIWVMVKLPKYKIAGKRRTKAPLIQIAFIIGFFQVVLYFIGGLFSGFGKSPYSFTPVGILSNLFFASSMLISMELSRAWLVNRLGKKHTFLALTFVALVYTVISIPLAQITSLKPQLESIDFLNGTLLPSVAENLLATQLAFLAGPLASVAYRGVLQTFWWFSPILPDLPWAFKGLIGAVVPIIALVVVQRFYIFETQRSKARKGREGSVAGWIVTTVFSVAIIWFAVGLFPIHPALVASGSMSPKMEAGDIVIIAKMPGNMVKLGDIIQFRTQEKITIMHRVIEVRETEGSKIFITKGDANNAADANPVIPANVVGKVVFTIRKGGWVAVMIKSFFTG